LELDFHLGDFIERQRAAVCPLETSYPPPISTGQCAAFMTEQLTLHKCPRNGCTINSDVRSAATWRVFMDGARHLFFARAALAGDQY
jgi:hypothetical protein